MDAFPLLAGFFAFYQYWLRKFLIDSAPPRTKYQGITLVDVLKWAFINTLAWDLCLFVVGPVARVSGNIGLPHVVWAIGGTVGGGIVGLLQSVLLNRWAGYEPWAGQRVVVLAACGGGLVGTSVVYGLPAPLDWAIAGAFAGAVVGMIQTLAEKRENGPDLLWVLATTIWWFFCWLWLGPDRGEPGYGYELPGMTICGFLGGIGTGMMLRQRSLSNG